MGAGISLTSPDFPEFVSSSPRIPVRPTAVSPVFGWHSEFLLPWACLLRLVWEKFALQKRFRISLDGLSATVRVAGGAPKDAPFQKIIDHGGFRFGVVNSSEFSPYRFPDVCHWLCSAF